MALPAFSKNGDLPIGVHSATLLEAVSRFGAGSPIRKALSTRLERIFRIASATGHLRRFVIFGSFITNKSQPNDVDVFMFMDNNFDMGAQSGEARLLFDHTTAQSHFGCSAFWIRELAAIGGVQTAIEDWQIKRDGGRRGIVEITIEV